MKPEKKTQTLSERVIKLIEDARRRVASVANVALVYTYYEIGRMIVEDEQGGNRRAGYGEKTLEDLSSTLTDRFGRGWSKENLMLMRRFFLEYSNSVNTVYPIASGTKNEAGNDAADSASANSVNTVYKIGADSKNEAEREAPDRIVRPADAFCLSWSHYLVLMRIADPAERAFYEREAAAGRLLCDRITGIFPQREVRFAGGSRNASLGILAHARQFSVQREARRSRMWGDNRLPGRRVPFSPENEFLST